MAERYFSPALLVVIVLGCTIAAWEPFDVIFGAITFGSAPLRAIVLALMALTGWAAGTRAGLRLEGHGTPHPVLIGLAAAFAVALYVAILDSVLLRSTLVFPGYAEFLHHPLGVRLVYFMARSFNENILYRLFVFSSLLFASKKFRVASPSAIIAAMVVAQCINIGANIMAFEHLTDWRFVYDMMRYVAPGVLWAWLYFRFGFATAEIAAVGCHVFLQPMFSVLLG